MRTRKEKPKFTPILSVDDIKEGDLFVIPGEPDTKRPRLHLCPKTLGSLGLRRSTAKHNREIVKTIFGNRDAVTLAVFTGTDKYISMDDRRAAQRANTVIPPDKIPLKAAYFCPLHTTPVLRIYKDIFTKRLVNVGVSMRHFITNCWAPVLNGCSDIVDVPSIVRPSHSMLSACDVQRPVMNPSECKVVVGKFVSEIPYCEPLFAARRFWDEMMARGAKVLRPANESAEEAILKSIMDTRLCSVPEELHRFYGKTEAMLDELRRETRTLRKIIAWWTKFAEYTDEERKTIACGICEAADIKNEGAYTLC